LKDIQRRKFVQFAEDTTMIRKIAMKESIDMKKNVLLLFRNIFEVIWPERNFTPNSWKI